MNPLETLRTIGDLLSVLTLIQSFEYMILARVTSDRGVWRWGDLEGELAGTGKTLRLVLRGLLSGDHFLYLNTFRIVLAASFFVYPFPLTLVLLFALHVFTLLRWLGSMNGGSDHMCLMLLAATSLGLIAKGKVPIGCLWFISLQTCLSYFRAGLAKAANPQWRNGSALKAFINSPIYEQSSFCSLITGSPRLNRLLSVAVILFELTFPLSLIRADIAVIYMAIGLAFHVGNAYVFGLNRFIYAWLATYPALYFCSLQTHH